MASAARDAAAAVAPNERVLVSSLLAEVDMLRERLGTAGGRSQMMGPQAEDTMEGRQAHLVDKVMKLLDTRKASLGVIADLEARLERESERLAAAQHANKTLEMEKAETVVRARKLAAKLQDARSAYTTNVEMLKRRDEEVAALKEQLLKKSEMLKAQLNRSSRTPPRTPPRSPRSESPRSTRLTSFGSVTVPTAPSYQRSTSENDAAPVERVQVSPTLLPSRRQLAQQQQQQQQQRVQQQQQREPDRDIDVVSVTSHASREEVVVAAGGGKGTSPPQTPSTRTAAAQPSPAHDDTIVKLREQLAAALGDVAHLTHECDALRATHSEALRLVNQPRGSAWEDDAVRAVRVAATTPSAADVQDPPTHDDNDTTPAPPAIEPLRGLGVVETTRSPVESHVVHVGGGAEVDAAVDDGGAGGESASGRALLNGIHTLLGDWGRAVGRVEGLSRALAAAAVSHASAAPLPPLTTRLPAHAQKRAARVLLGGSERAVLAPALAAWRRWADQRQVERRYRELVELVHAERGRVVLFRDRLAGDLARRRAGGLVQRYFHTLRRHTEAVRLADARAAIDAARREHTAAAAALTAEQTLRQTKEEQVRAVVAEIRLVHLDKEDIALRWDIERVRMETHVKGVYTRAVRGWSVWEKRRLRALAFAALQGYATLSRARRKSDRSAMLGRVVMKQFKKSVDVSEQHMISRDFITRDEAATFRSIITRFYDAKARIATQFIGGLQQHALRGYVRLSRGYCEYRTLAMCWRRLRGWAHVRLVARAGVAASLERSGHRAGVILRLHAEGDANLRTRTWRKWAVYAATSAATKYVESERAKARDALERATAELYQADTRHRGTHSANVLKFLDHIAEEARVGMLRRYYQAWVKSAVYDSYTMTLAACRNHETTLEVQTLMIEELQAELAEATRLHVRTHRAAIDLLARINTIRLIEDHWVAWRAFVKSRTSGYHRLKEHLKEVLAEWCRDQVKLSYARLLIKWMGWEWRRRGRDILRLDAELDNSRTTQERLIHKLKESSAEARSGKQDQQALVTARQSLEEANSERAALQSLNDELRAHQAQQDARHAALAALHTRAHGADLQLGQALAALDERMAETARLPLSAQWGDVMVFLHNAKQWWRTVLEQTTQGDAADLQTPLTEHIARAGGVDALVLGSP